VRVVKVQAPCHEVKSSARHTATYSWRRFYRNVFPDERFCLPE